jgi:plasmid stabilization system protein ParE
VPERFPVRLHPRAEAEARAAYRWYAERNELVAEAFYVELDAAISRIAETPHRWPRILGRFRRFLLGRFPFSLIYIEQPDCIEVIAIAHHRRRPRYWLR